MVAWQAISITACNLLQTSTCSHPAPWRTKGLLLSRQPSVAKNADEPWPDILLNMPSEQRAFFKCLPCQNSRWVGHREQLSGGRQLHRERECRFCIWELEVSDLQLASSMVLEMSLRLSCLSFLIDIRRISIVFSLPVSQEVLGIKGRIWNVPAPTFLIKNYLVGTCSQAAGIGTHRWKDYYHILS